ncbi:MAG: polysaccharide biosynthesis C-terminal domain-containing protein [Chitinophagia bacterium]|jgi:O-antigen/teichoic acid export membrane protein
MGEIRKQTIISSLLVYLGFGIGAINMLLYSAQSGPFSPEMFGLTRIFFDFAQNMFAFGALGVIPVIYKFYPYYKDNLQENKIDLITWGMISALGGILLILALGWYFEGYFVKFYSAKSSLVVTYYSWMIPFAIGMLVFSILEGFNWAIGKSVISNFLKETFFRIITFFLIVAFYLNWITYQQFIHLFSLQFLLVFLLLLCYLIKEKKIHLTFTISRVTHKYWKKMLGMQLLTFGGTCIASIAATIDVFIIAGFQNLQAVGIFVFAQYAANLIQVPQRSIQAVSAGVLSRAWKEKNLQEINRIYERSCINLLLLALFIFGNIWLNVSDAIQVLHIKNEYANGLGVLFVLGMVRIIDAGTGLNALVINTSTFWKFDFYSGVILLAFRLPLTYFLIREYGILGSAIAELVAYSVYNFIRFEFLRRKFGMQPFRFNSLFSILLAVFAFAISYVIAIPLPVWPAILVKSAVFSILMMLGIFYGKLTPDAHQLWEIGSKRWKKFGK